MSEGDAKLMLAQRLRPRVRAVLAPLVAAYPDAVPTARIWQSLSAGEPALNIRQMRKAIDVARAKAISMGFTLLGGRKRDAGGGGTLRLLTLAEFRGEDGHRATKARDASGDNSAPDSLPIIPAILPG